jgi:uncharacterized glyoxalase superfamily metalloenzyme YdcJ
MTVMVTHLIVLTATMSTAIDKQVSSQERQRIFSELRSLRQDTQAFRTEAYRLRTAGSLDAATNERLRAKQQELEQRGTALIGQYAPLLYPYLLSRHILIGNRLRSPRERNVEPDSGMRHPPLHRHICLIGGFPI